MGWFFGYYWDYENGWFRCPHCKRSLGMSDEDLRERGARCNGCGYISYIWDSDSRKVLEERRRQEQDRLAAEQQRQQAEREQAAREQSRLEAWNRAEKHRECGECSLIYPRFLVECPECFNSKEQQDVLAETERHPTRLVRKTSAAELSTKMNALLDVPDFPAIGNAILEVLLQPHQLHAPDEGAEFIRQNIAKIIAAQFEIPEALSYEHEYRDKRLPFKHRGRWETDFYPSLIIFAYVLGATWTTLPQPHLQLCSFYQRIAARQEQNIEIVKSSYKPRPKPPVDPNVIREILESDLSEEEKQLELMRLMGSASPNKQTPRITPD